MSSRLVRRTSVAIDLATGVITGRGRDCVGLDDVVRDVEIRAVVDTTQHLVALETSWNAPTDGLVGRRVASGFRAALSNLTTTPDHRLLRRMMWDLPILVQVGSQTLLLDHPGARADPVIGLSGADQCSGWRSGGEMLTQISNANGVLRMPLTPEVSDPWEPRLAPMATRRARTMTVTGTDPVEVKATYRDSYADPDGVERALHEWMVDVRLDDAVRIAEINARPGQLPWLECPFAGQSARALAGLRLSDIEAKVAADFNGTSTCTHLNDTLRSLTEVPDLLARNPS
jgi:hypothetical protein